MSRSAVITENQKEKSVFAYFVSCADFVINIYDESIGQRTADGHL